MPIIGLSDQTAALPIIGQLRKGAKKPQNSNRPGKDLEYFRFTSEDGLAREQFYASYPAEPAQINVMLPHPTTDENIDAWMEHWVAGGLKTRCDGQTIVLQQQGDGSYSTDEHPCRGQGNCQCKQVGRLSVIVPELGRLATVTVLTTSIHDIRNLTRQLRSYEALRSDLRGIPFILTRRPVEISTPGSNGKRVRREKWLLSIETQPTWTMRQLQAMERAALPNVSDGEIVEGEALSLPEPKFITAGDAPEESEQPALQSKTNGTPKKTTDYNSPANLFKLVNAPERANGYYRDELHLRNAIRKVLGDDSWTWPPSGNREAWAGAGKLAVDHARAELEGESEQDEPERDEFEEIFPREQSGGGDYDAE